jgi:hypothetical protein
LILRVACAIRNCKGSYVDRYCAGINETLRLLPQQTSEREKQLAAIVRMFIACGRPDGHAGYSIAFCTGQATIDYWRELSSEEDFGTLRKG